MRWLPEHVVGIVAMGNLTCTGWGGATEKALGCGQAQVSRLVARCDHGLADSLAAMNLYLDEPKERRRVAIEALVRQAGGDCRADGTIEAENALRGGWRMRCRDGDLGVFITLAPTEPAGVQFLEVRRLARDERMTPGPVCR